MIYFLQYHPAADDIRNNDILMFLLVALLFIIGTLPIYVIAYLVKYGKSNITTVLKQSANASKDSLVALILFNIAGVILYAGIYFLSLIIVGILKLLHLDISFYYSIEMNLVLPYFEILCFILSVIYSIRKIEKN